MTLSSNEDDRLRTIGEVVNELQSLFPDVSHSSLRFLEREGFITATRTEGGHRLYTAADVARIARIKRWQSERLSLDQIKERLAEFDRLPDPRALAAEFVGDAVAGDLAAAGDVITRADEVGLPLETLFAEVMTPALHEIGDLWESGEVSVAREKEVSELSRELIVDLTRRHATSGLNGQVIVAACVEGERHELGLRMFSGLLRARGYRVSFLGADVALNFLLDAVETRSPVAVLLSAKQHFTRPALESALQALDTKRDGKSDNRFAIVVGGEVADQDPELIRRYGAASVSSTDAASAIATIEAAIAAAGSKE